MKWIDFPPVAEFEDRNNIVRAIYGTTIFGRFEFAQRMTEIYKMLDEAAETLTWESLYLSQTQFRNAINKALGCWGINPDWLTPQHIEQLLFFRGDEPGWLIELSSAKTATTTQSQSSTLAEAIAVISTHCQSLQEALELANNVPADLLGDVLNTKAGMQGDKPLNPQQRQQEQYLKDNFDELMARF